MLSELLWEIFAPVKVLGQAKAKNLSNRVYIHGTNQWKLQEVWTKINANNETLEYI